MFWEFFFFLWPFLHMVQVICLSHLLQVLVSHPHLNHSKQCPVVSGSNMGSHLAGLPENYEKGSLLEVPLQAKTRKKIKQVQNIAMDQIQRMCPFLDIYYVDLHGCSWSLFTASIKEIAPGSRASDVTACTYTSRVRFNTHHVSTARTYTTSLQRKKNS